MGASLRYRDGKVREETAARSGEKIGKTGASHCYRDRKVQEDLEKKVQLGKGKARIKLWYSER